MAFVGARDEMEYSGTGTLRLAAAIRERRVELERLGWRVTEIPERDHGVFTDPSAVVPIGRAFLDSLDLGRASRTHSKMPRRP